MSDLSVPEEADPEAGHLHAGGHGFQVGDNNFQVNYFPQGDRLTVTELTVTDGTSRPPFVESLGTVESPYRGLGAFGEKDAPFFHGREAATQELLDLLSEAAQGTRLLAVSGVSGAGKSSLLRAGVVPRIRYEGLASAPGGARWTVLPLTPTREPLEQLALQAAQSLGTNAATLHAKLADDPVRFAITARQLALRSDQPDGDGTGRVLLIVDQFEEVFTQCTDDSQRRMFVAGLCSAATTGTALVVIVVRADFEARCADFPELTATIKGRHGYLVTAMDELQLRTAIEGPVATLAASSKQPLSVEASLVDYLVREMRGPSGLSASGAGALPLLSHALDQAWRHRSMPALTLADYERGGRIQGAVETSADRAFQSLTPSQQAVARQVFLRLTATSDDGTTARDRVPQEELLGVAGPGRDDDVAGVLDAFTRERLITQAAASVEISHDALLTAWPLLRDEWLAGSRADLAVMSRLRGTAQKWADDGRKPGLLYRDEVLDEAVGAVGRTTAVPGQHPVLSTADKDFLQASVQARRNTARRRTIVRRAFVTLTACLALAVAGLAVAAGVASTSLANANRDLSAANVQQMSAESAALRSNDPPVSELAAADAWHTAPSDQTRDLAIEAATNPLIGAFDAAPGTVAVSPDGSVLAVSDSTGFSVAGSPGGSDVTLWSMTRREVLAYIPFPASTDVYSVAFSPVERDHGATLAVTTSSDGTVLYQVSGSSYQRPQTLHAGVVAGSVPGYSADPVAFSDKGMLAAPATTNGGDILLFADVNGRYLSSPTYVIPNTQYVDTLSFAPDGSLAVGTASGTSVYPPANGYTAPPTSVSQGTANPWTDAQFNAGAFLAVTTGAGAVVDRYVDGTLAGVRLGSTGQASGVQTAALSNRNVLAVAKTDGLHLYVTSKAASSGFIDVLVLPYPGQQEAQDVAFSPDGNTLIENITGKVYIYDTRVLTGTQQTITAMTTNEQANTVMEFDPADPAILATATPSAVNLVDVADDRVSVLPHTGSASWVSFAPDGALAVVSEGDVWLLPRPLTDPALSSLVIGTGGASRVAFSPAGAMAVVSGQQPALTVFPPGNFSSGTALTPRMPGGSSTGTGVDTAVFGPSGQLAAVVNKGSQAVGVAVFAPDTYAQQGFIPESSLAPATNDRVIAFAPDGTLAIAATADIQIYAPGSYQNPRIIAGTLSQDDSGYSWLAFSHGGVLVSADSSTGLSLWDDKTGQNLATFALSTNTQSFGIQIAVSPDGKYLAFESAIEESAIAAGVTITWSTPYLDGDVADGVRAMCGQLGSAPAPDQWQQYFTSGLPYPRTCS